MNIQHSLCPTADRLAQLVSGSLVEAEAEFVLKHIDGCASCQIQVDDLSSRRRDPIIQAARTACSEPVDGTGLSRLIRSAAKLPAAEHTRKPTQAATKSISAAEFVHGLRRSGLFDHQELSQVLNDLSWDESERSGDSGWLARALIEHRKLTPFQAKLLLRGRWKGLVLGNYAILDKLGQGGMGSVFKARHTRMGRIVCLKVVNAAGRQSSEVIDRFRNEARALAALSHPNIVVAHDADESKGIPYLVMEFVDGEDLAKRVRNSGPLDVTEALDIGIQTARALWYAHGQGLIHRDVKPHNLVATRDVATGETFVKVLDLGLARFDSLMTDNPDASVLAAMTNTGVVIGTVDYMAPEQALDSRNADARSDIYSLGCTMFFLLAGRAPFCGETIMQRLVAHREQPAPNLNALVPRVTRELDAVIQKMLAKKPADRYASMDAALADLQAVSEGRTPSLPVDPASVSVESISDSDSDMAAASMPLAIRASTRLQRRADRVGRRARFLVGTAAIGMACLVTAILFILSHTGSSVLEPAEVVAVAPAPPVVVADQAIRNGGDGRALVLVSSRHFKKEEFKKLAGALKNRNVTMVVASGKCGTTEQEFGQEIKSPYLNINLVDAEPTDYDAVFVLGGENRELSRQNPEFHQEVKRIVEGALKNKIVVTGCTEGYHHVLKDTGLLFKKQYQQAQSYKFDVCSSHELAVEATKIFVELKETTWKPQS